MGVTYPVRIGGFISAFDSDSISTEISVDGLPIGTKVWNEDVGLFFTLTLSSAALVPDEVLLVKGIDGARWIVDAASFSGNAADLTGTLSPARIADGSLALTKLSDVTGPVVIGLASGTGAATSLNKSNTQTAIWQKEYYSTLSGAASSVSLTLDGDTDGDYEIDGGGSFTSDPVTMKFQINGSDSGITALSADALVGGSPSTSFVIARNGLNPYTFLTGNVFTFTGRLTVKQGRVRSLSVTVFVKGNADQFSAGFSMDTFTVNGQRSTSNDNITSFSLVASAAVLASGTWIRAKAIGVSN